MENQMESLMQALLSTMGRIAFKQDELFDIVDPIEKATKNINAFNLADGTLTQAEIIRKTKIDGGNFSRTLTKWIEAGVMFRLGEGRDAKLLHIYPLPAKRSKNGKAK